MLTLLLGNSLRIINSSIDNQAIIKEKSITPLLDSALSIPLFQRDSATLIELLEKLVISQKSEFTYITVYDDQGNIFAEIDSPTTPNKKINSDKVLHISSPLTLANEKIGDIEYGLSIQSLYDSKDTLLTQGLLIAFFEIILTILLLGLAGFFLTRHVAVLLKGTQEISSGNYNISIPIQTNDEIGLLASEFNTMSNAIKNRIDQIYETSDALIIKTAEFESIFNSIADGVIFIDTNRTCIRVNPAMIKMFGYSIDKFINHKLDFLYFNEHEYEEQNSVHFSNDSPDITDAFEASYVRSDDSVFFGELLATRVKDKNGIILGFIGILRDIHERKQQEEQLRRSLKMDALGKLTGGIAHDYNNMLGVILGYAELLEIQINNSPDAIDYINEIKIAGERGSKLTKKLLSFSKQKASDKELLNINSVLLDEQNMLKKTLTARIQLNFKLANDLWPIYADKADLIDVIINLSINSMHAIKENGTLTFDTLNEKTSKSDADILQLDENDYVLFSIIDTGCGMNAEEKERIFEPFYSTKGEMGTGLGLSQVYGFIQRCGGNIKVYSEPNHGTRITMYFPRHFENESKKVTEKIFDNTPFKKDSMDSDLLGNEIILTVDDEPALLKITTTILKQYGYTVLPANSAAEALDILSHNNNIDLMITDIIMPEMDGYELSEIVQQKYPNIKIQLVSGYNDNRHVKSTNKELYQKLLHKPYNSQKLLQKVRDLLSK